MAHKPRYPKRWTQLDHNIYKYRVEQGLPWSKVATQPSINKPMQTIYARWQHRLSEMPVPDVEQYRAQANSRIEDIRAKQIRVFALALATADASASNTAIANLIRLEERTARLNGLDRPIKLDVGIGLNAAVSEMDTLMGQLDAYTAGAIDATATELDEILAT